MKTATVFLVCLSVCLRIYAQDAKQCQHHSDCPETECCTPEAGSNSSVCEGAFPLADCQDDCHCPRGTSCQHVHFKLGVKDYVKYQCLRV